MDSPTEWEGESVINIMIATDNHLGFYEKDPIRGEDSFITFEEILQLAVEKDVDFILLGGDLFHDATPSQNSLYKCIKLLRQYTQGDREISLEIISDQSLAFHDALNQTVNYEDPKLKVSIPVFSINGNHDDPSNFGTLSSLNLLAVTGLVNYFGRCANLSQIDINPILLRKGETQIALYGLSYIRDGRLNPLFETGKVIIEPPDESTEEWFNLMVLHQNRAFRGPKNHIEEEFLPEFLDLVVWGHEHDCRIKPELNKVRNFRVTQPGSSVATSLSVGESKPKHVAFLQVLRKDYKLFPLPLQTVRPFIFKTINLSDYTEDQVDAAEKVQQLAQTIVEEMIAAAEDRLTGHPKQPKLPLIRLKIVYNHESQVFNAIRFGQQYNTRVANPADVVILKKPAQTVINEQTLEKKVMECAPKNEEAEIETSVDDFVNSYFDELDESKKLQVMTSEVLSEMFSRIVKKNDVNAAGRAVDLYQKKAVKHLTSKLADEDACSEEIKKFQQRGERTLDFILKSLDKQGTKKDVHDDGTLIVTASTSSSSKTTTRSSKADEEMEETKAKPARGGAGDYGKKRHSIISIGSKPSTSTKQAKLADTDSD